VDGACCGSRSGQRALKAAVIERELRREVLGDKPIFGCGRRREAALGRSGERFDARVEHDELLELHHELKLFDNAVCVGVILRRERIVEEQGQALMLGGFGDIKNVVVDNAFPRVRGVRGKRAEHRVEDEPERLVVDVALNGALRPLFELGEIYAVFNDAVGLIVDGKLLLLVEREVNPRVPKSGWGNRRATRGFFRDPELD
jgi:hypothetical protein